MVEKAGDRFAIPLARGTPGPGIYEEGKAVDDGDERTGRDTPAAEGERRKESRGGDSDLLGDLRSEEHVR